MTAASGACYRLDMRPWSSRLLSASLSVAIGLALALLLAACAATLPFLSGAFDALCPLEAMIPTVGMPAAATCPGQDALVAGAIAAAEKGEAPPAGTSVELVAGDAGAGAPHAYVYKLHPRGRRLIGHGPCHPRASASSPNAGAPPALPTVTGDTGKDGAP